MVRKLLIAEDNKFTAIQYKKFLEANGYKVTVFNEGIKCFEKYTSELRYKQVILKQIVNNCLNISDCMDTFNTCTGLKSIGTVITDLFLGAIVWASSFFIVPK